MPANNTCRIVKGFTNVVRRVSGVSNRIKINEEPINHRSRTNRYKVRNNYPFYLKVRCASHVR